MASWNIAHSPQGWEWLAKAYEEEQREARIMREQAEREHPAQTTTDNLDSPIGDDGSSNGGGRPATTSLSNNGSSRPAATNLISLARVNSQLGQLAQQQQQTPQVAPPKFCGRRRDYDTPDKKMYYICDDCGTTVGFYANELLRCVHCGGMTMKKPRIKGTSQFVAV
ncbi:uncharacterized protein B0T15DRAFT_516276 [Chaetomium strumarium]|uniref:Uncharacterized protein n=1 Tax=Chaetomium strumarium TaxID=1170767 RepID=A0AAJ0H0T2_9PEZI|nr:hypothetical protein B0T15DRAFT_516276 [Chaetomium strumarium]